MQTVLTRYVKVMLTACLYLQKNKSESYISRICNNPLGFVRLHIARLIATLIATGSSEVRRELAGLGTLNLLLVISFCSGNDPIYSFCLNIGYDA